MSFNQNRFRILRDSKKIKGPVVYWMSRDQRVEDNWALIYSNEISIKTNQPLIVVFTITNFPSANLRHYDFMLGGLVKVEKKLRAKNIPFYLLKGDPPEILSNFIVESKSSNLISDFDPLLVKRQWKEILNKKIEIPHHEVDTHNIVPCWVASTKQEFGAHTIRPKITKLLPQYLTDFPQFTAKDFTYNYHETNWEETLRWLNLNQNVKPVNWIKPGEDEALIILNQFTNSKLIGYSKKRNDPNLNHQSNLSPYLHFGQISAQRIAIEVTRSTASDEDKNAFLEELIIRRELSDNFCFYNNNYIEFNGFHEWAKKSLKEHWQDEREYLYSIEQLENAQTHDELWNAAQMEMVITGKMHGFMRMYWAKKILEWTPTPTEAIKFAIFLNDKYSLDGRDPNGYAGIAWSIGGVHDRPWSDRPIFGKIRYMNYNGCKRKFDVQKYVSRIESL